MFYGWAEEGIKVKAIQLEKTKSFQNQKIKTQRLKPHISPSHLRNTLHADGGITLRGIGLRAKSPGRRTLFFLKSRARSGSLCSRGAGYQRPGTAAPRLPALAVGSSVAVTHSWAGTLLQVTARFASSVPFGTQRCHGMMKILSVKQRRKSFLKFGCAAILPATEPATAGDGDRRWFLPPNCRGVSACRDSFCSKGISDLRTLPVLLWWQTPVKERLCKGC